MNFEDRLATEFVQAKQRQSTANHTKEYVFNKIRQVLMQLSYLSQVITSVIPVGSTVNDLVSPNYLSNDLDIVIFCNNHDVNSERSFNTKLLLQIASVLQKYLYKYISNINRFCIDQRIQVLTIQFSNKITVDFTIQKLESLRTTSLIRAVVNCDFDLFGRLFYTVHKWAIVFDLKGSKSGGLSSTAINLIIIHFLQVYDYIPQFDSLYFSFMNEDNPLDDIYYNHYILRDIQITANRSISEEDQPSTLVEILSELFLHFSLFKFKKRELFFECGRAKVRSKIDFDLGPKTAMYIRNPFTQFCTTRSVQRKEFRKKFKNAARSAYNELRVWNWLSIF